MLPNEQQWNEFYGKFKSRTGLDLHQYKAGQLQRRILTMIEARGAKDLAEFWNVLNADSDGMTWFMDKLAINVSELFRNPEKWAEMKEKVLPTLLQRSRTLKTWSAGCSIGAEAHTLACLFEAHFRGPHTIVGTDIDAEALAQANSGAYRESEMRAVPKELKEKFFSHEKGVYTAQPEIKKYLKFRRGNLLADRFESGFDLIMCRNVVIYFTDPAKDDLYQRFYAALKPGGILFVGSTERIVNAREIGFESTIPFFYQKPLEEQKSWRIAS